MDGPVLRARQMSSSRRTVPTPSGEQPKGSGLVPDSKYGRLFTETDMVAFAFLLSGIEPERIKARLAEAETYFPADEPAD